MGFSTASLVLFALEVAAMVWLLNAFWQQAFSQSAGLVALAALLLLTAVAALTMLGLQAWAHSARRWRERDLQARLEHWTQTWLERIWTDEPFAATPVGAMRDPASGEALLRLRETLRDEDSYRAAQLYQHHGFLARDLRALRSPHQPLRAVALEQVSRARHPSAIFGLERSLDVEAAPLRALALLALARVCARLKLDAGQLVALFAARCCDPQLSSGTVERCLVLLERNSAPVITALLDSNRVQSPVRSALEALGLVGLPPLAGLAAPWLHHASLDLRCAAARALYRVGVVPDGAYDDVLALLGDAQWPARAQGVLALSGVDAPSVNGLLYVHLGDAHWWVRHNSALALSKRGAGGLDTLHAAAATHPDRFARDMARQQLLKVAALEHTQA
jgi:HEAT repeat protein